MTRKPVKNVKFVSIRGVPEESYKKFGEWADSIGIRRGLMFRLLIDIVSKDPELKEKLSKSIVERL